MAAPSFLFFDLTRLAGRTQPALPSGFTKVVAAQRTYLPALCRGTKSIAGTVSVVTTPAPTRAVGLFERTSLRLVRTTTTDSAGRYRFDNVTDTFKYVVMALDFQPAGYNAAVADYITPT